MSDLPEWTEFVKLVKDDSLSVHDRLVSAMRAIDLLEVALSEARTKKIVVMTKMSPDAPKAWKDLVDGLTLLSRHQINSISPLHCEHDELSIMSDPHKFTKEELINLGELGFHVRGHDIDESDGEEGEGQAQDCTDKYCEANFYSYRFGSA